jgi:hypothetical protein
MGEGLSTQVALSATAACQGDDGFIDVLVELNRKVWLENAE